MSGRIPAQPNTTSSGIRSSHRIPQTQSHQPVSPRHIQAPLSRRAVITVSSHPASHQLILVSAKAPPPVDRRIGRQPNPRHPNPIPILSHSLNPPSRESRDSESEAPPISERKTHRCTEFCSDKKSRVKSTMVPMHSKWRYISNEW